MGLHVPVRVMRLGTEHVALLEIRYRRAPEDEVLERADRRRDVLGDPDEIDGLATSLRSKAEDVRAVADDHVRAGQAAHWVSDSASAHRDRIWADRVAAYAAADEMDEAANLVNRHADAVRERLAAIATAAAAALDVAREAAADVGDAIADGAEAAADGVGDAAEAIGDVAEDVGESTLTVLTGGLYQGRD